MSVSVKRNQSLSSSLTLTLIKVFHGKPARALPICRPDGTSRHADRGFSDIQACFLELENPYARGYTANQLHSLSWKCHAIALLWHNREFIKKFKKNIFSCFAEKNEIAKVISRYIIISDSGANII